MNSTDITFVTYNISVCALYDCVSENGYPFYRFAILVHSFEYYTQRCASTWLLYWTIKS